MTQKSLLISSTIEVCCFDAASSSPRGVFFEQATALFSLSPVLLSNRSTDELFSSIVLRLLHYDSSSSPSKSDQQLSSSANDLALTTTYQPFRDVRSVVCRFLLLFLFPSSFRQQACSPTSKLRYSAAAHTPQTHHHPSCMGSNSSLSSIFH